METKLAAAPTDRPKTVGGLESKPMVPNPTNPPLSHHPCHHRQQRRPRSYVASRRVGIRPGLRAPHECPRPHDPPADQAPASVPHCAPPPWRLCDVASSEASACGARSGGPPAAPRPRVRWRHPQAPQLHSEILLQPSPQAAAPPPPAQGAKKRPRQLQRLQRLCAEAPSPGPRPAQLRPQGLPPCRGSRGPPSARALT